MPTLKALTFLGFISTALRKPQKSQFDMDYFHRTVYSTDTKEYCNTAACAIGLAATLPQFIEAGFKLASKEPDMGCWTSNNIRFAQPTYHGLIGFPAVRAFFGLTWAQANYLFHSDSYPYVSKKSLTPKVVADRIDDFIIRHGGKDGMETDLADGCIVVTANASEDNAVAV